MAIILFANNASSTLAGAISPSATVCNLAAGTGALFPSPSGGDYFVLTFVDVATGLLNEIVHVTNRTVDQLTIVRAQEGTTALNWLSGDLAANLVTAGVLDAMIQQAQLQPSRIVTASGVFVMTSADGAVGLNRVTGLAVSSTTLPADAAVGQVFQIEDLNNNFQAYPTTVNAPVGMTIDGAAAIVLNVNKQCGYFRYYGSNVWSVKQ